MSSLFCQNILHFPECKRNIFLKSYFSKKLFYFLCAKGLKSSISMINLVDLHHV